MQIQKFIEYWNKGAEDDFKTAQVLFDSGRNHHSLFFCHLVIEKMLKAVVTKNTKEPAPYGHSLVRLAELTGLDFSQSQLDDLAEITTFNIRARYDDHKRNFYKKATKKFTQNYIYKTRKLYLWLEKHL